MSRIVQFESSLAVLHPDVAAEWHPTKNDIQPWQVTRGSNIKVWWLGKDCGHTWDAVVSNRARLGFGCPYCSGKRILDGFNDFATLFPGLHEQWHPTRNIDINPHALAPRSHVKVWWKSQECGHEWDENLTEAVRYVTDRGVDNRPCPYCHGNRILPGFNDLQTLYPSIAAEWHPTMNGDITVPIVSVSSAKEFWWLGKECGHEWLTAVVYRTNLEKPRGCPYCANQRVLPGFNDLASKRPEIATEWHPKRNGSVTPQEVTEFSNVSRYWLGGECGQYMVTRAQ